MEIELSCGSKQPAARHGNTAPDGLYRLSEKTDVHN